MTALGLIETRGLIGAIEGADAMLKAAEVRLLEKNCVGGGLVTITIAGEVSAVRASVDAAIAAIRRIDGAALVSEHVIARPDEELKNVISLNPASGTHGQTVRPTVSGASTQTPCCCKEATVATTVVPAQVTAAVTQETIKAAAQEDAEAPVQPSSAPAAEAPAKKATEAEPVRYSASQLKKMSVNKLRQLARTAKNLSIMREEIGTADKKDLVEALTKAYRQIEE